MMNGAFLARDDTTQSRAVADPFSALPERLCYVFVLQKKPMPFGWEAKRRQGHDLTETARLREHERSNRTERALRACREKTDVLSLEKERTKQQHMSLQSICGRTSRTQGPARQADPAALAGVSFGAAVVFAGLGGGHVEP